MSIQILENVRNSDVYIIQPTCPPVNDNLMELLLCASALRRASASRVTAVVPYYGYVRVRVRVRVRANPSPNPDPSPNQATDAAARWQRQPGAR